jgi:GDP-L-fucose synthase
MIHCVIHSATTSREGTNYPPNTCEDNLRMFFNVQKCLSSSARLINLGSGSEYDRRHWKRKMSEEYFDMYVPDDSHSFAKYLISKYIRDAPARNIVCLRLFGVFGRYEDYRYRFISNTIVKNILALPVIINQNVVYDYLWIDDLCRIAEFFVHHTTKRRIYNVTPTQSIDLLTIASLINDIGENKSEIQVLNEGIGVEYSGDNSTLLADIGAFEFTDYKTAIRNLYGYYTSINLDVEAVRKDDYLEYAKRLGNEYFKK